MADTVRTGSPVREQAALAERDKLGPCSMAKGSAFPHARTEKVADFRIAVGTAPQGLDFKAPDGNPIRLDLIAFISLVRIEAEQQDDQAGDESGP